MIKKETEEKLAKIKREAEERDAQRRAAAANLRYVDLSKNPVAPEALSVLDEEIAKAAKIAVIAKKMRKIAVAAVEPENPKTKKVIEDLKTKGFEVSVFVVSLSGLLHALNSYKFVGKKAEEITGSVKITEKEISEIQEKVSTLEGFKNFLQSQEFKGHLIERIFDIVLFGALINRASDIHFEPREKDVKLRLRIDGLLNDVFFFETQFYNFLVSRVKLLSGLKINIHDEPQDGRFSIKFIDRQVEVRVAVAPSEFGEVIVMRLLDPAAINLSLADLGLREDDLKIIETELKKPNGLILNTGPTGSGKTTTLYAFLKYKKSPEIKIITVEDPIEYHLEGIEQTQVDEGAGYTFASGLRSLMRQDPDVILVGEIRDKETAEIGIQAALTGHLVFSTIHANEAAGAIPRLLDLNVRASSIAPSLNLIIAQRLVRRLCKECKAQAETNKELKAQIAEFLKKLPQRINRGNYNDIKIFKPAGCQRCNNLGYKGRVAIYELLQVGPSMEEMIQKEVGEVELKKFALEKQGMTTMQQDGILKVVSGLTTLEEIEGVTGPIEW